MSHKNCKNDKLIGAHLSLSDGLLNCAKKIRKMKGNIIQIFTNRIKRSEFKKNAITEFMNYVDKYKIKIIIHTSYKINIARKWTPYSWWVLDILNEIEIANKINAIGIVIHIGNQLDLSKKEAYTNMFTCLMYIIKTTKRYNNIKLILETVAGQGTEMCHRLEELSYFYKMFSKHKSVIVKNRIKLCIDTCHIFAAGYDIRNKEKIKVFFRLFNDLIGIKNVALIHLNDSKNKLGSRVDRHAAIGNGEINKNGLIIIYKYFKNKIPIILETPSITLKKDIKILLNI
jgi:deoxyribonuclease-4